MLEDNIHEAVSVIVTHIKVGISAVCIHWHVKLNIIYFLCGTKSFIHSPTSTANFGLRVLLLPASMCVCVRQYRACMRHNLSLVKARTAKFGLDVHLSWLRSILFWRAINLEHQIKFKLKSKFHYALFHRQSKHIHPLHALIYLDCFTVHDIHGLHPLHIYWSRQPRIFPHLS